ncbi:MAG: hypothetical protein ACXIUM_01405 [Wenzhouxiangella sp.]
MKITAWIVLTLCISHAAMAAETILVADFNNKPLNQPIGTGGAAVGEPTSVSSLIEAVVRAAPGGGRMLEMFMEQRPSTQSVIFQFLDDQEVSSGSLVIRARLRLAAEDEFTTIIIRLREANGASQSFMNMNLTSDGRRLQFLRPGVSAISIANVLNLSAANDLEILYSLDDRHVSVCLNGALLIDELPTLFESTRGIGRFLVSLPGAGGDHLVGLEDLRVERRVSGEPVPDVAFSDRFEATGPVCPF